MNRWIPACAAGLLMGLMVLVRSEYQAAEGATGTVIPSLWLAYIDNGVPSPTPTPTRTPTPTSTPQITSTPSPTFLAGGLSVLPATSSFPIPGGDELYIIGEVVNGNDFPVSILRVSVRLYDQGGQPLQAGFVRPILNTLESQEKTCFAISIKSPGRWSTYTFDPPTAQRIGTPLPSVTVLSQAGTYNPATGGYAVTGSVRNDAGTGLSFVPVATLYNAAGTPIGCIWDTYSAFPTGQTRTFQASTLHYGRDLRNVSYRLQIERFVDSRVASD